MSDLLQLIGRDTALKRTSACQGGEYSGPCPICRRGTDRFKVWPQQGKWACLGPSAGRSGCDRGGDAIQYLRERDGLSYQEACARLGEGGGREAGGFNAEAHPTARSRRVREGREGREGRGESASSLHGQSLLLLPNPAWQARARQWAQRSAEQLWKPQGAAALAWLHARGLHDPVLRRFLIGYNAEDVHEPHALWGLTPPQTAKGGPRSIWLPRGITIPWFAGGALWRLNVRRPLSAKQIARGAAKYIGPAGFGNALYNADSLAPAARGNRQPCVLVEGEFDALTVIQACADQENADQENADQACGDQGGGGQACGDQGGGGQACGDQEGACLTAVATGSTAGARRLVWVSLLAQADPLLVAFDRDEAGSQAAAWWLSILPDAHRLLPLGHDVNTQPDPALVRAWLQQGLAAAGAAGAASAASRQEPITKESTR